MKMIECECPKHGIFFLSVNGNKWLESLPSSFHSKSEAIVLLKVHCPICKNQCKIVRIDSNGD
jgi:hypothetical protein